MIKRQPTKIELKYDDDICEYEELKKRKQAAAPATSQPALLSLARPLFGPSGQSPAFNTSGTGYAGRAAAGTHESALGSANRSAQSNYSYSGYSEASSGSFNNS